MYIQVKTVINQPIFEVADDIDALEIDSIVKIRYGAQKNLSPHDWVGLGSEEADIPLVKHVFG